MGRWRAGGLAGCKGREWERGTVDVRHPGSLFPVVTLLPGSCDGPSGETDCILFYSTLELVKGRKKKTPLVNALMIIAYPSTFSCLTS
jgi:hypothetical protein